jgi:hypothetical protein
VKGLTDILMFIFLVFPWLLVLFVNGCYIMFGGRIRVRYIGRQGFIFQIKIRHPRKVIQDWAKEGTE